MPADRPRSGVRLTDAEREHAAARVHAAHGEGRISLHELDQRLAVVYAARVAGDLVPVLDDLPTDRERALLSGAADAEEVVRLVPGPDGIVRRGRWPVPRRILVDQTERTHPTLVSAVVLDLREAVVPHPRVDLELRTATTTQLVLPLGASADLRGLRGSGPLMRTDVPTGPVPGKVHVVVRGVVPRRWMVWVAYRPAPLWWRLLAA